MARKNHYRLLGAKQLKEVKTLRFNYGPINGKKNDSYDDDNDTLNIPIFDEKQAKKFQILIKQFQFALDSRRDNRNKSLKIPYNIEYIEITFLSQFAINKEYEVWFENYGLQGVSFSNFNQKVIFAISDHKKFNSFINDINNLIQTGLNKFPYDQLSERIKFVGNFHLLSSDNIFDFTLQNSGSILNLNLVDLPLDFQIQGRILKSLFSYLEEKSIAFIHDEEANKIEVSNPNMTQLKEVVDNFDIILSVTSSISTVISPSSVNTVKRSYGFEILSMGEKELPIIGIVDTGISMSTPLSSIVLNDTSFSLDGSNPHTDICGKSQEGHGTAVAALAALGRKAYKQEYRGKIIPDAKLLSIKLFETGKGGLSEKGIIDLLRKAKSNYPQLRLFVLTVTYNTPKKTNERFSSYTYELDRFAYETDSLIFISTGNNDNSANENSQYDLNYFNNEVTNICTPADSMNNIVIGAAADSLKGGVFYGISNGKEFPTLYTRKSYIDLTLTYPVNKANKHFFKPDVIECGGDYESSSSFIGQGEKASLEVLSANPSEGFYNNVGTSFATPLVANLAAKILHQYSTLNSQTIKALIINGASLTNIKFERNFEKLLNKVAGHGLIDIENSLDSNENRVTFVLEDRIENDTVKIYPIYFPEYLTKDNLGKQNGVLKVTATLCFKFDPIKDNHLSYCPVHIAFSFFKNQTCEQILSTNDEYNSKIRSNLTWSQTGRHKTNPIPYSNSQKIQFNLNVEDLKNEKSTLKLAVQCRLTSQLLSDILAKYPKEFDFSLVVTIEETTKIQTGKLYDALALDNYLEEIVELTTEGDIHIS